MLDHDLPHYGLTERESMEQRIEVRYVETGRIDPGLALQYAQRFGVEAEKTLIAGVTARNPKE
jgi:hypothetical protein